MKSYNWLGNYVGIAAVFVALVAASFSTQTKSSTKTNQAKIIPSGQIKTSQSNADQNAQSAGYEFSGGTGEVNVITKAQFENWILCRSDEVELFFSLDKLSAGTGSITVNYMIPQNPQEPEKFSDAQVQEYIKSPSIFLLRLSNASDPNHTQLEINTTKNDGDAMYQGKLNIDPLINDKPKVKGSDISCTPLTRRPSA